MPPASHLPFHWTAGQYSRKLRRGQRLIAASARQNDKRVAGSATTEATQGPTDPKTYGPTDPGTQGPKDPRTQGPTDPPDPVRCYLSTALYPFRRIRMLDRSSRLAIAFIAAACVTSSAAAQTITAPKQHFGFNIG